MNTHSIIDRVIRGEELSTQELLFLLHEKDGQEEIIFYADNLNRQINHDVVTFVHNRNINYTNICINRCLFCAFRRDPYDRQAFLLPLETILERIASTPNITEVCIQGGIFPGLRYTYILDMVQSIRKTFPTVHVHAFSPMEIKHFSTVSGKPVTTVLEELIERGLGSIPGTAAEILNDEVRQRICPQKITTSEWVGIIKTAHQIGLRSTCTILFGHIETAENLAEHFEILRNIQRETSGFTEFIPLLFTPFQTALGKLYPICSTPTLANLRTFYALSRIFFYGWIDNIQVSWPKLGLDGAIACLSAGVNDLGGTLYEENITRSAGGSAGERVSLEELTHCVLKAGKRPRIRDTLYKCLS